jgi:hypothetical protein
MMKAFLVVSIISLCRALGDCNVFTNSCSASCAASPSSINSATCSTLTASCTCQASSSIGQTVSNSQFCTTMTAACSNFCTGGIVDSNSCDPTSGSSSCQCRTASSQAGGPLFTNQSMCLLRQSQCQAQCAGRSVPACVDPNNYTCVCVALGSSNNIFSKANTKLVEWTSTLLSVLFGTMLAVGY